MFIKRLTPYYYTAQVLEMDTKEYHLVVTNFKSSDSAYGSTPYFELVRIYQSKVVAQKACDKLLNVILSARVVRTKIAAEAAAATAAEAALDFASWQLSRRPPPTIRPPTMTKDYDGTPRSNAIVGTSQLDHEIPAPSKNAPSPE